MRTGQEEEEDKRGKQRPRCDRRVIRSLGDGVRVVPMEQKKKVCLPNRRIGLKTIARVYNMSQHNESYLRKYVRVVLHQSVRVTPRAPRRSTFGALPGVSRSSNCLCQRVCRNPPLPAIQQASAIHLSPMLADEVVDLGPLVRVVAVKPQLSRPVQRILQLFEQSSACLLVASFFLDLLRAVEAPANRSSSITFTDLREMTCLSM